MAMKSSSDLAWFQKKKFRNTRKLSALTSRTASAWPARHAKAS
jgi:hypothetical protein